MSYFLVEKKISDLLNLEIGQSVLLQLGDNALDRKWCAIMKIKEGSVVVLGPERKYLNFAMNADVYGHRADLDSLKQAEFFKAIDERFPNAQFVIWCFDTIEEIENKMLNNQDDQIIFVDSDKKDDCYVINKKPEKDGIYYCDVIDELIRRNLSRNCYNNELHGIMRIRKKVNMQSINRYRGWWGS